MSFLVHLCNKTSKKSPLWPSKVKKQSRKVTKQLPFEEAFMTHHIFFPQKVVVLRKTSLLLWKKNDILWKASTTLLIWNQLFWVSHNEELSWPSIWSLIWPWYMIFGSSDAEFQEVFEGIKKWIYQKWPKQRDSNGRPDNAFSCARAKTFYDWETYFIREFLQLSINFEQITLLIRNLIVSEIYLCVEMT